MPDHQFEISDDFSNLDNSILREEIELLSSQTKKFFFPSNEEDQEDELNEGGALRKGLHR